MLTRRQMLERSGMGLGMLALRAMWPEGSQAQDAKKTHFRAKAKRLIHIFAEGGPSQVDTWDPKPILMKNDGKNIPPYNQPAFGSPWKFQKRGQSGIEVSELFPKLGEHVDKMALIRTLWTDVPVHGVAQEFLYTGSISSPKPSLGSWISYGLGSANQSLPSFITLGGNANWRQSVFLPGETQGVNVNFGPNMAAADVLPYIRSPFIPMDQQRKQLDMAKKLEAIRTREVANDPQLEARIESFEKAFRMQTEAPEAFDIGKESEETRKLYGDSGMGASLLAARRLIERGVRVVQVNHPGWDHHSELERGLPGRCEDLDGPAAGLLTDLQRRGLLEDTLVVWCGEFGRTVEREGSTRNGAGRNHNASTGACWIAGGGVKAGTVYGKTDDFGGNAVENRVHTHDLQATLLALLGFDHEKLTYRYNGRDFRLTDNYGTVIRGIIA